MNREQEHQAIRRKAYERAYRAGWRARAAVSGNPDAIRSWRIAYYKWLRMIHVLPGRDAG